MDIFHDFAHISHKPTVHTLEHMSVPILMCHVLILEIIDSAHQIQSHSKATVHTAFGLQPEVP